MQIQGRSIIFTLTGDGVRRRTVLIQFIKLIGIRADDSYNTTRVVGVFLFGVIYEMDQFDWLFCDWFSGSARRRKIFAQS